MLDLTTSSKSKACAAELAMLTALRNAEQGWQTLISLVRDVSTVEVQLYVF
jgi:hypothetical protein